MDRLLYPVIFFLKFKRFLSHVRYTRCAQMHYSDGIRRRKLSLFSNRFQKLCLYENLSCDACQNENGKDVDPVHGTGAVHTRHIGIAGDNLHRRGLVIHCDVCILIAWTTLTHL